jgi:hypothetical protein
MTLGVCVPSFTRDLTINRNPFKYISNLANSEISVIGNFQTDRSRFETQNVTRGALTLASIVAEIQDNTADKSHNWQIITVH